MAQTIKLKRSANSTLTSGQGIPTTSNLELGEVAINTYHGKMYIKKNDGSESIVEVGAADNTKLPLAGGTMTGALNMGGNNITSPSNLTLDVATNINLDAGSNGSIYLKDDGLSYGRLYRSGTPNHFNIKSTVNNADIQLQGKDNSGTEITALTLDMSDAGAAIFNGHGTFNDTVTINSTSTGAVTVSGSGGGINLTGGNNRIYFGGQRAMEGITSNGNIQIGEGFAGNLLLQMHTEVQGNLSLGDNRNLRIGSGPDLQLYHDGNNSYIKNDTGILIIDAANDIRLDAGGGDIRLYDDGVLFANLNSAGGNLNIKNPTADKDITFIGKDGSSSITALTLDMSEGGSATFANNVTISGNLEVTGTTTQTGSIITNSNFTGLSDANSGNATDFGFYGKYVESSTTKYAGMYYDASTDNTFKLFCDTQTAPTTTVNESATGYALANLNIAGLTTTGNVGIGIANTTAPLVVQAQSNAVGINLVGRTSDSIGELNFASSNGTNQSSIQSRTTDLRIKTLQSIPLTFHTVNTERVRIDSSGNFMVGKTTQGLSNAGFEIAQTGQASATQSGASALRLNRLTSDGEILQFRKASVTVGNIATVDGDLTIFSSASGHKGLRFGNGYIAPTANSTNIEDNTVDLGLTSARFKNLHLSGSANIGTNILMSNASTSGFMQVSTNILQFGTSSNDPLAIFTNNAEQIRIDTDGRLLLNTTSSIDNLSQLHIVGFTSGRAGITLQDGDSSTQKTFFTQSAGTTRFNTQNGTSYGAFQIGGWNGTTSADFVRITSDGRVGIGTTGPAKELDVVGTIRATDNSNQHQLRPTQLISYGTDAVINAQSAGDDVLLKTQSNTRLIATAEGNVGIGTTVPTTAKLVVQGSDAGDLLHLHGATGTNTRGLKISLATGGATNQIVNFDSMQANGILAFKTAGTERMRIHDGGNVGIGTASPSHSLHVVSAGNGEIKAERTSGAAILTQSQASLGRFGTTTNHNLQFMTNSSGHVTITTAGRVGIGTTAPSVNLEVENSSGATIMVDDTNGRFIKIRSANSGSQNANISSYSGLYLGGSDNASHMLISNSGNVGIGSTNPAAKLHVVGPAARPTDLASVDSASTAQFQADASNAHSLYIAENASGALIQVNDGATNSTTAKPLALQPFGGNVGIGTGTTAPSGAKLHVAGGVKATDLIAHDSTGINLQTDEGTKRLVVADSGVITFNQAYSFPTSDGSTGQALVTDGSGNITFGSVSAGAASSMVDADGDTKIQVEESSDDDVIRFDTAGSQRMIINASGNVGINDNTPGKTLSVNGTFKSTGEAFFSHFDNMTSSSRMRDNLRLNFGTTRTFAILGNSTNMHIRNSSADIMTFDTNNRVGIGTSSPQALLHVSHATAPNFRLSRTGTGQIYQMSIDSSGRFLIQEAASEGGTKYTRFVIDDTGEVGIGTGAPEGLLHVSSGTSGDAKVIIEADTDNSAEGDNPRLEFRQDGSLVTASVSLEGEAGQTATGTLANTLLLDSKGAASSQGIQFATGGRAAAQSGGETASTTRMTILGNGNIGIGTAAPAKKLHVDGVIGSQNSAQGTGFLELQGYGNTAFINNSGSSSLYFRMGSGYSTRMTLTNAGSLGIGTTSPASALDVVGSMRLRTAAGYYIYNASNVFRAAFHDNGSITRIFADGDGTNAHMTFNGGNVGIGTDSPGSTLDVHGNTNLGSDNIGAQYTTTLSGFSVSDGSSLYGSYGSLILNSNQNYTSTSRPYMITNALGANKFAIISGADATTDPTIGQYGGITSGSARLVIDNAGNVGIGNDSPNKKVHVAFSGDNGLNIDSTDNHSSLYVTSGQGYGQYIRFADDSANYWINADTNGRLNFRPAGTSTASNWVVFDSNGSVGVGTSSLTNKFHVSGNARIEGNLMAGGASATNVPARPIHVKSAGNAAAIRIEDTTSSNLAYDIRSTFNTGLLFVDVTNGSTRMTIADDGNVGIGTTSPGAKLQVEDAGIDTTTTSTSATTQVAIDTFAAATFRSAEFTIQVKNSTDSTYHLTKVLLIHDGTTPAITEYGTIFTGSAAEATFDADISSGNVRLLATPASTDSMTFKVVRHCITV